MRWKLTLEYHGGGFAGWQAQTDTRTVQGTVEDALEALLGHPVRLTVSGRTDAGVHALAQVASFETAIARDERAMLHGLNHFLPPDVACIAASPVPDAFDPRRWSWGKRYRYTWLDRAARSPLRSDRAWQVSNLDAVAMHLGAQHLIGDHDFSSFRSAGCAAAHARRVVESATVVRDADEIRLDVVGQGFLRHMVRIIAGTLTEVGRHKRPPAWVGEVLAARDRTRAGLTAPPHGLCMVHVRYEGGPPPWIHLDDEG